MFAAIRSISESIFGKSVSDLLAFAAQLMLFIWLVQLILRTIRDFRAGYAGGIYLGKAIANHFTADECRFISNDPACMKFIREQIVAFQDNDSRAYTVDYSDIYYKVLIGIRQVASFKAYRSPTHRIELMRKIAVYRSEQAAIANSFITVEGVEVFLVLDSRT